MNVEKLFENSDKSWLPLIKDVNFQLMLNETLSNIGTDFYPKYDKLFRFMDNNVYNTKYIIVGMDPYPSDFISNGKITPQATGRSFEVASVEDWNDKFKQTSLQNILKSIYLYKTNEIKSLSQIREEINKGIFSILPPKELFDSLEKQGVLFLNATLSVEPGKPNSHKEYWNNTMDYILNFINNESKSTWLLWGNDAKDRVLNTVKDANYILAPHPRLNDFIKCDVFSQVNDLNWCGF